MTRRLPTLLIIVGLTIATASLVTVAQRGPAPPRLPGRLGNGAVLLPNGWTIAPAGTHVFAGDLPLSMTKSPDGRYLIITNNGWSKPTLTIVDLQLRLITDRVSVEHAWFGLAWHPDGKRLYSAGGGENTISEFVYQTGQLKQSGVFTLGRPERARGGRLENAGFVAGLAVSPDGRTLYSVQVLGKALTAIDLTTSAIRARVELDAEPYTCMLSPDGSKLYVSLWGGAKVQVFDPETLRKIGEFATGEHPNAMVFSKDGARLFVACANTNAVWVLDLAKGAAREQISVALYPNAPAGSTPNALALSPDGETLYVANADNNTVAVADIAEAESKVEGFIPTGWYPTGVLVDQARNQILVLSGKGLTSQANPRGPNAGARGAEGQYIAQLLQGALSFVPAPDEATLKTWTKRVYEITPYRDAIKLTPADAPLDSPVPKKVGDPSPIKYVFYVIRENRTYDQILGDLERGNGDPSIALFGEEVTPNAHALAREFVVFDNFYVNAEVSYDGHAYSTAAYATDFVEKVWPTNYGGRGGIYLSEGGGEMRNAYGNIAAPADGYLWDFAKRAGVTVRSYGEFADWDRPGGRVRATVPGLEGLVHPSYPPYDLGIPDNRRVDIWLEEFRQFEQNGQLPRLSIIRLGNDHTSGTRPGAWTPRAMVAENDLALGRLVEAISKSRYWKESAIFVLEDDAQNGPDHVDAHRSVALVASPFAKRNALDSTLYTTASMLRTLELVLGIPPMSQLDAAATPMYGAFQPTPVQTPYTLRQARVSLTERNGPDAPGAEASMRMNLEEADLAPELELNEIIWKSVHGRDAVMPPPVRAAFLRPVEEEEEEARGRSPKAGGRTSLFELRPGSPKPGEGARKRGIKDRRD